jgi:UDP-2,3-diacylglucosamine hydrolase
MKYTLFIADLHLEEPLDKITALLRHFIKDYAAHAEALYILGDLFKYWAGDDDRSPFNEQVKTLFKQLSLKGVKIYLMPGNRDFLLSKTFALECGVTLIRDPYKINIYGIETVLTHGDILCSNDTLMNIFRFITRSSKFTKLFLKLPLAWRKTLANWTHKYSNKTKPKKSEATLNITDSAIAKLLQYTKADLLIHGHTHKIGIHDVTVNNKTLKRVVLGSWEQDAISATGNFLIIYTDGKKKLMQFRDTASAPCSILPNDTCSRSLMI